MEGSYGASVRALVAVISELRRQTLALADAVEAGFGRHPDVEIYLSQPGLGPVLGAPTTPAGLGEPLITRRCVPWATGSSASCTAACAATSAMTRPAPGSSALWSREPPDRSAHRTAVNQELT